MLLTFHKWTTLPFFFFLLPFSARYPFPLLLTHFFLLHSSIGRLSLISLTLGRCSFPLVTTQTALLPAMSTLHAGSMERCVYSRLTCKRFVYFAQL